MAVKKKRSEVKAYHLVHHGTNRQFARFGNLDPETIAKLKKKHPEWDWREEKIAWHFTDDPNLAREYGDRVVSSWIDTENFKLYNFRGYNWASDHGEKLNNVITQAKEKGYSGLVARNIAMSGKDPESKVIKSDHYIAWKPHTVRSVSSGEELYEENEAGLSRVTSGSSFHQASSNAPEGKIKLPTVLDAGALAKTKTPDFFNYFRDLHADNKKIIQKQQEKAQKEQEKAQKQQEKAIKKQEQIMKQQEQQQKKAAKEQQKALKRMFESVQRYSFFITEQSVKTAPDFSRQKTTPPPTDAPPAASAPPSGDALETAWNNWRSGNGNLINPDSEAAMKQRFSDWWNGKNIIGPDSENAIKQHFSDWWSGQKSLITGAPIPGAKPQAPGEEKPAGSMGDVIQQTIQKGLDTPLGKQLQKVIPGQRFPTNSINQPPTGNMEILKPSAPKLGQSQSDSNIDYNNRVQQQKNFDTTGVDKLSLHGASDYNQRRLAQSQPQQQSQQQPDAVQGAMNVLNRPGLAYAKGVGIPQPQAPQPHPYTDFKNLIKPGLEQAKSVAPQPQPQPTLTSASPQTHQQFPQRPSEDMPAYLQNSPYPIRTYFHPNQPFGHPEAQIPPLDSNTKKMANYVMGGDSQQNESVINRFLELEKTPDCGNKFAKAKKLHEIFGKDNNQLPLKKSGSGDQMATTIPTRDLTNAEGGKQAAFTGSPFNAAGVSGSPGTQSGPAPTKINDQPSSAGETTSSGGGSGGGASPEQQQSRQGAFSGDPFSAAGIKGMPGTQSGTQSGGDGKSPTTGPSITGTQTSVVGGPPEKLPVSPEGGKRRNANKG